MKSRNFLHQDRNLIATRTGKTVKVFHVTSGKEPLSTLAEHQFPTVREAKAFMNSPTV